jgi:xanthine/uracil/vitamin C permease (AzgA family)
MQGILIGFGAALLLCGSVRAQELENTNWDDGPGAVPFVQQASAQVVTSPINSDFAPPTATIAKSVVTQAGVLSQSSPVEEWVMGALLVCTALVVLYAMTETRRRTQHVDDGTGQINSGDALQ